MGIVNPANDQQAMADEWAAAMAEQSVSAQPTGAAFAATEIESTSDASRLFPKLSGGARDARNDIDMVLDIPVQLTVELGRTRLPIKHILQLAQGSVIELDALAGEPMDVLVNGCLIAQGEVVVVNDKFGIRLTDIVTPSERVRRLNRN